MNVANISYARNHLSELIDRVRGGESIVIMDRQTPVACLGPTTGSGMAGAGWKDALVRKGIIHPARHKMDIKHFKSLPVAKPSTGGDILAALLSDREEGL